MPSAPGNDVTVSSVIAGASDRARYLPMPSHVSAPTIPSRAAARPQPRPLVPEPVPRCRRRRAWRETPACSCPLDGDHDRVARRRRVVLAQLVAQPPRIHPHDRIGRGAEACVLSVQLGGQHVLLERMPLVLQGLLDDEGQERGEAIRAREEIAGQNPGQFAAHLDIGRLVRTRGCGGWSVPQACAGGVFHGADSVQDDCSRTRVVQRALSPRSRATRAAAHPCAPRAAGRPGEGDRVASGGTRRSPDSVERAADPAAVFCRL